MFEKGDRVVLIKNTFRGGLIIKAGSRGYVTQVFSNDYMMPTHRGKIRVKWGKNIETCHLPSELQHVV